MYEREVKCMKNFVLNLNEKDCLEAMWEVIVKWTLHECNGRWVGYYYYYYYYYYYLL